MERKSPVWRIGEILIQVSDVKRSLTFYRDGLGIPFEATRYGDDSFVAKVGEVRVLLHPDFDDSLRDAKRGLGVIVHLWVPDADAYCEEIRQRGIAIAEEPEDRPWGRHFSVVDPDGYRIDVLGPIRRRRADSSGLVDPPLPAALPLSASGTAIAGVRVRPRCRRSRLTERSSCAGRWRPYERTLLLSLSTETAVILMKLTVTTPEDAGAPC